MSKPITPQMLVWAYSQGIFPMAESRHGEIGWYSPDPRTIMPLESFHVPRSLAKRVRQGACEITRDSAFERVIRACSEPRPYADDTWINDAIIESYIQLHGMDVAHSMEAWADGELVGGLYGVALGGAFFGESMFSRAADVSKVCLVHLVEHLRERGYVLLDVQFTNPHLDQFGIAEIPRASYLDRLHAALRMDVTFG